MSESYDPDAVRAFASMPAPPTVQALSSFLAAANWFRDSVGRFSERSAPLHALHMSAMEGLRNTRTAREQRSLADLWTDEHETAFRDITSAVATAPQLGPMP